MDSNKNEKGECVIKDWPFVWSFCRSICRKFKEARQGEEKRMEGEVGVGWGEKHLHDGDGRLKMWQTSLF